MGTIRPRGDPGTSSEIEVYVPLRSVVSQAHGYLQLEAHGESRCIVDILQSHNYEQQS